ncbi:hypothetical protein ACFSKN_17820 [Mariniflexile gromovii]|uniref:Uncharacterized protein n=1 Tax=Mariniflexile gromovii TaxID=362523 RepID=A0ABS4BX67_9FLAO|nr:hypothetical protein [Mariniflexile gromovii]MBP0905182.1 hypothetical protein [Mariniflexile gromovii]
MLDVSIMTSSLKNIGLISPKKENNKKEIKTNPKDENLTKKKINNTGMKRGIAVFIMRASFVITP